MKLPSADVKRPLHTRIIGAARSLPIRDFPRMAVRAFSEPSTIPTLAWLAHPGRSTWEMGQPLWTPRAVAYLARHLRPGDRVFEWGSGGSTVWLLHHGAVVTSVEHDASWVTSVRERCPEADIRLVLGADNGLLRSEPNSLDHGEHFFDDYVATIDAAPDDSLNVVIVDGMCRLACLRQAVPKLKNGGILVLDDTERPSLATHGITEIAGWRSVVMRGFKAQTVDPTQTTFFYSP